MGLTGSLTILDEILSESYVKILDIVVSNRDVKRVRILIGTYITKESRDSSVGNFIGGRIEETYSDPSEEVVKPNYFFTEKLIKKKGLFGEAYRFLKSLERYKDLNDV